jgi:hypothetical protein
MNWRCLRVVRAATIAGLVAGMSVSGYRSADGQQDPALVDSPPGVQFQAEAVDLLRARDAGLVGVELRGAGEDEVRVTLRNSSPRRLSVVVPPGLVALSVTGQFQSMGLGLPTNRPGSFGEFRPTTGVDSGAFKSVPPGFSTREGSAITLAPGRTINFSVPAVCLNFGIPEPSANDEMLLMDVADYTPDERARRALRSIGTLGTSRNVAQAVAWNVFNSVPFSTMTARAPKSVNRMEGALAARFLEALDQSSGEVVEPAYVTEGRLFVRLQGEGDLAQKADILAKDLEGKYLMGLPVRVIGTPGEPSTSGPALYLIVTLTSSSDNATAGRVAVKGLSRDGRWNDGGTAKLSMNVPPSSLDSSLLAEYIDSSVARQFVAVKKVKRVDGGTVVEVVNRLPFTLSRIVLQAAGDTTAPVPFEAVGISPLRSAQVKIPAAEATIGRVELNGL